MMKQVNALIDGQIRGQIWDLMSNKAPDLYMVHAITVNQNLWRYVCSHIYFALIYKYL